MKISKQLKGKGAENAKDAKSKGVLNKKDASKEVEKGKSSKSVKAAIGMPLVSPSTPTVQVVGPVTDLSVGGSYEQAIGYIQSAINELTALANTDIIARDSISNLAVVLFDLKGV